MSLSTALIRTVGALHRNPVLFAPVALLVMLQVLQVVLRAASPGLANLLTVVISLLFVFVWPFVHGGLVGMADEALTAATSLSTFVREGRRNYLPLLVVSLCVAVLTVAVIVVVAILLAVGVIANYPGGAGDVTALLVALILVVALVTLGYLSVVVLVQFYAQAVVVDGDGVFESITRSVRVVRTNPVSVLGYSVVVGVSGVVIVGTFGFATAVASGTGPLGRFLAAETGVAAPTVVAAVAGILFGSVYNTLSVAFYRALIA